MNRRLYVGNLAFRTEEGTLSALFSEVGAVESVNLMRDKSTGLSRGFAFVEMETEEGAQAAIERFNEQELEGRRLTVNEARPKPESTRTGRAAAFGGRRDARW
jgi:RNA recognition motif-containing protein